MTSSNPNLQQVPAVEQDRYKASSYELLSLKGPLEVRSAVVPEEGKSFIVADYGTSQAVVWA